MELGIYNRTEYKILAVTLILAMAFDIVTTIIMLRYGGATEMNPVFKHVVNADNPIPMTVCKGIIVIIFLFFANKAYNDLKTPTQKKFYSYSMILAPTFVTLLVAFFNFWQIVIM
jgi:hypothetical protein